VLVLVIDSLDFQQKHPLMLRSCFFTRVTGF